MGSFIEFFLEIVLQFSGELILDLLGRSRYPVLQAIGSLLLAAIGALAFGVLSVTILPHPLISQRPLRIVALIAVPILNGWLMASIGRRFIKRGWKPSRVEHFLPAFVFSLVFGAIRFVGAR